MLEPPDRPGRWVSAWSGAGGSVERHEYRTARWVTVAGVAGGAAFLLLGAVQVSAYFQHYQGANLWELADGIACVLLGAAPIVEAPRARVLVVTDHGLSGFRNLHPVVI